MSRLNIVESPSSIRIEQQGPVLIVQLCRPEKRNAFDDAPALGLSRGGSSVAAAVAKQRLREFLEERARKVGEG